MLSEYIHGSTYFVTLECFQRQRLLAPAAAKQMLIEAMHSMKSRFQLHVAAYAVLDDHAHLLLVMPKGGECLAALNYLRAYLVRRWREHTATREDSHIWNHALKLRPLADAEDLRAHIDYIHYDAVRHGLCERAYDYAWSSLRARVEQGHYPEDWAVMGPPASLRRVVARR